MVGKGIVRERPQSAEEAREFIKGYSDDRAFAVNFVLVSNLSTGATRGGCDIPEIKFQHIPVEFINRVVNQADMICVTGGLKLTYLSVLPFIKELVGTADSVRGLPSELTEKVIQESLEAEAE
ncbi:maf-like protein DDB_G0281937 [Setaria italica]|uniref:maf-like protein DDB_G0281937 n=1 Tax=Setaria italica TaxID=4555 RepID=UPI0003513DAC|nr:maf-like protein DDB_G0281937 [Setaria italica]